MTGRLCRPLIVVCKSIYDAVKIFNNESGLVKLMLVGRLFIIFHLAEDQYHFDKIGRYFYLHNYIHMFLKIV